MDYRENTIIVVSNSNKDGASAFQKHYDLFEDCDSSSLEGVRKSIYCISQAIFSSNEEDRKYFLGKKKDDEETVKSKCGSLKPCIHGSDAHTEDELFSPDKNRYCWIKADPTFEGLKQIIYEPEGRVKIQEEKPISPVRKISNITLNFEKNTDIRLKEKNEQDIFCFSGVKEIIPLNDYFNCFIGGRGTGKSTLLNLIYKSFYPGKDTDYFNKNKIILDDKEINISETVILDSTAEKIEFLQQNQIEDFAIDPIEFTKAIYDRLKNKEIEKFENIISESIRQINKQIENIQNQLIIGKEIEELNIEYKSNKKITDTLDKNEYKIIIEEIQNLNNKYLILKNDRDTIESLINDVDNFLSNHIKYRIVDSSSEYNISFNKFIDYLEKIKTEILDNKNFIKLKDEENTLLKKISEQKEKLEIYLTEQGLSEENLEDVKTASTKTEELKIQIEKKKLELKNILKKNGNISIDNINKNKNEFGEILQKRINEFINILDEVNKQNPKDVDKIELSFSYNEELAKSELCEEFHNIFKSYKKKYNTKSTDINDCLFQNNPYDLIDGKITYEEFMNKIKGDNQYNQCLNDIFKKKFNYEIYLLLLNKYYQNLFKYLKIDVMYKNKPMLQASFGQKCTAVIIIMLLFGHNPIIIDEPEAHLDSSLIANYLVNLIMKEKIKRQIIFATHNANFVINADAEQIYILEMPEKRTNFIQTTIENQIYRDKLLKLEGGSEAFKKRENKYGLKK